MANIEWRHAVKLIEPYVLKIKTPRGSGTGFLCAYTKDHKICGKTIGGQVSTLDKSYHP